MELGTPVVLSDIPALREVAGKRGMFVGVADQAGWTEAIDMLSSDRGALDSLRSRIEGFAAMREAEYFVHVREFLRDLQPLRPV